MPRANRNIPQMDIFDYTPNTLLLDLNRLEECWKRFPIHGLLEKMNLERGNGRDDNPNLMMAKILFACQMIGLPNISVMVRVLAVSDSLRDWVGMKDMRSLYYGKESPIPQPNAFTNFETNLIRHQADLDLMFSTLRNELIERIDGFGVELAGDGKYFDSYACHRKEDGSKESDRRGEHDADYSKKVTTYQSKDGEKKSKTVTHYGFRKHTLVDVKTELPFASALTVGSMDEKKAMVELVFPSIPIEYRKGLIRLASFDRGYDSTDFMNFLRRDGIQPIIDKRMMKKEGTLVRYRDNVFYDDASNFFFMDNSNDDLPEDLADDVNLIPVIDSEAQVPEGFKRMKYEGFDRTKYKVGTPDELKGALVYSYQGKKTYVYISDDPRAFNEIARDSDKFKRLYKHRTTVERYHSRLDSGMMFEQHTIRGLAKMKMQTTWADIVILTCAKTHLELGQENYSSIFNFGFLPGWNG